RACKPQRTLLCDLTDGNESVGWRKKIFVARIPRTGICNPSFRATLTLLDGDGEFRSDFRRAPLLRSEATRGAVLPWASTHGDAAVGRDAVMPPVTGRPLPPQRQGVGRHENTVRPSEFSWSVSTPGPLSG